MTITDAQLFAGAIGAGIGFFVGALIFGLIYAGRAREQAQRAAQVQSELAYRDSLDEEREAVIESAGQRLGATFDELANRSLQSNSSTFLRLANENLGRFQERASASLEQKEKAVSQLVAPITEALKKTRAQIDAVEKERHASFGSLTEQLRAVGEAQRALQAETGNLVGALKRPEVRGQWGELTLRRIAELSGMVAHCDFEEQVHRVTDNVVSRPDMVVRLPESRSLVVDSKTPLDAYLAAFEATSPEEQKTQLARHARHIREHVKSLAAKKYWQQFESAPEFVVLFLPGDPFLSAALDVEPEILDDALRQKVIVTTPSSLMALLKTVAHGWRQMELNENAKVIRDLAQSLYQRLSTFSSHLARVGQTMEQSVKAYNAAVGSLERQVLPGARKFTELGVSSKKDIPPLDPVEESLRTLKQPNESAPATVPASSVDSAQDADSGAPADADKNTT
ncbi:MAG: DNA recombination protein RmuC [Gammaproteobacteria bacterium]